MSISAPGGPRTPESIAQEKDILLKLVDTGMLDLGTLANRLKLQVPTYGITDFSESGMARAISDLPINGGYLTLAKLREEGIRFDSNVLRLMGFEDGEMGRLAIEGILNFEEKLQAPDADADLETAARIQGARAVIRSLQGRVISDMRERGFEVPTASPSHPFAGRDKEVAEA